MKYIIVSFLIILIGSCANPKKVTINKVEHLYISSTQALDFFHIFEKQFGLPVVWEFQNWGSFTSGGISLGNVVLEIVEQTSDKTRLNYGIALESSGSLEQIIPILDSAKIIHTSIEKSKDWNLVDLTNLLPDSINLFLCDYNNKSLVEEGRKTAKAQLKKKNGGSLGVLFLREIIIGSNEKDQFETELKKLPGIIKNDNSFSFPEGPRLKLIHSDVFSLKLMIKVASVESVKEALEKHGFETTLTNQGLTLQNIMADVEITFCY